jgi:DEAD/DEAH box helicase domain-containing protein
MSNLNRIIKVLQSDVNLTGCITFWNTNSSREGIYEDYPTGVSQEAKVIFERKGFKFLYKHQAEAINLILGKNNVVVSTGTASGKSLCYQIPILNQWLKDKLSTALIIFPTKALTYDQLKSFQEYFECIEDHISRGNLAAVYDGDTPSQNRPLIRKNGRIILTNPDMLHISLLPHHTEWAEFFKNLKYVVIDELHLYRGIFGSHIANLIRRLKRIIEFYAGSPTYILTSATIGNPKELAEKIIEDKVFHIEDDCSPKGEKHFAIYNPPLINEEFGIREGLLASTTKISSLGLIESTQTLVFCKTRKLVELIVRDLHLAFPGLRTKIRGYRSGYLKTARREIESNLKDGAITLAAATNALELGVDIGGVDFVIMAGYPGSIVSIKQRAGRAGRNLNPSLAILITSMNPLDQYFARNPDYLIDRPIEHALIDPDNPLILLSHLQAAVFELPYKADSSFGQLQANKLIDYWDYLCAEGIIHLNRGKFYWVSEEYPSGKFSIRSTASNSFLLQVDREGNPTNLGEIDFNSGLWMCHPGAIYLHDGETFFVDELNLEKSIAFLSPIDCDYTTEPIIATEIVVIKTVENNSEQYFQINYGEIEVNSQVTGFKKISAISREILLIQSLDLPVTTLHTFGTWIILNDQCVQILKDQNMWLSDPNDYGQNWRIIREEVLFRDAYSCQVCGVKGNNDLLHVHHKIPFKLFTNLDQANSLNNLVTLCPDCHRLAELSIRIRSGLSGLRYAISNLAPLLTLSDFGDLNSYADPTAKFADLRPSILIHDTIPAGIGLSHSLYQRINLLLQKCDELIGTCSCKDGCPSCVGPISETGMGGKKETLSLLSLLLKTNSDVPA